MQMLEGTNGMSNNASPGHPILVNVSLFMKIKPFQLLVGHHHDQINADNNTTIKQANSERTVFVVYKLTLIDI